MEKRVCKKAAKCDEYDARRADQVADRCFGIIAFEALKKITAHYVILLQMSQAKNELVQNQSLLRETAGSVFDCAVCSLFVAFSHACARHAERDRTKGSQRVVGYCTRQWIWSG